MTSELLACDCAPEDMTRFQSAALVVGHPGHELRVFGWLAQMRPLMAVITDGSGSAGTERASVSARLAHSVGAARSEVFGGISDSDFYRAILEHRHDVFLGILDTLAADFVKHKIDIVAGDTMDGFNPAHDLCRLLIDAAVLVAERETGRAIANYQFDLTEWELEAAPHHDKDCAHYTLGDALLRRKWDAAHAYGAQNAQVQYEAARASEHLGEDYFRLECLKKIAKPLPVIPAGHKPAYEVWGERRVDAGTYDFVIRFGEHMAPIVAAIRERAFMNAHEIA